MYVIGLPRRGLGNVLPPSSFAGCHVVLTVFPFAVFPLRVFPSSPFNPPPHPHPHRPHPQGGRRRNLLGPALSGEPRPQPCRGHEGRQGGGRGRGGACQRQRCRSGGAAAAEVDCGRAALVCEGGGGGGGEGGGGTQGEAVGGGTCGRGWQRASTSEEVQGMWRRACTLAGAVPMRAGWAGVCVERARVAPAHTLGDDHSVPPGTSV